MAFRESRRHEHDLLAAASHKFICERYARCACKPHALPRYDMAAGAFRHIGREGFADEIGRAMRRAGYDAFREVDPFVTESWRGKFK